MLADLKLISEQVKSIEMTWRMRKESFDSSHSVTAEQECGAFSISPTKAHMWRNFSIHDVERISPVTLYFPEKT